MATVYPTATSTAVVDARSRSQRGLHVGDEAPRRRLRLGELGHGEGEENDGEARRKDRERCGDTRCDGDHTECEIEIDTWSNVRNGRGGHVRGAELAGPEMASGPQPGSPTGLSPPVTVESLILA